MIDLMQGTITLLSYDPAAHTENLAEQGIYLSGSIQTDSIVGRLLAQQTGCDEALIVDRNSVSISIPLEVWHHDYGTQPRKTITQDTSDAPDIIEAAPPVQRTNGGSGIHTRDDILRILSIKTARKLACQRHRLQETTGRQQLLTEIKNQ